MADSICERVRSGSFEVVGRLDPPRNGNLSQLVALAASWKGKIGSVLVTDNASARLGGSALLTAERLGREGIEPILTVSCRDGNRIALGSTVLGAVAASLRTLLCVSGDHPAFGDHQDAKPVYDMDSVQLIAMVRNMEQGRDASGNELEPLPRFCLAAAACASADPLAPQLSKARKKVRAGVDIFVTLPVFRVDQLEPFLNGLGEISVKVIAGVLLPRYEEVVSYKDGSIPGTFIPHDLVEQWRAMDPGAFSSASADHVKRLVADLRSWGKVAGVCISAPGREDEILGIL
ncbi:MAG: methylenetetrahydrofolate reductase [Desulfomonile sp.]|nr:methylenetetrahydrofolate reductase [Desulfomonile sp.]